MIMAKEKTKEEKLVALLDHYVWCTRGSKLDDDYAISDEDDFDQFLEEFRKIYPPEESK
jgi:hypothetical protein